MGQNRFGTSATGTSAIGRALMIGAASIAIVGAAAQPGSAANWRPRPTTTVPATTVPATTVPATTVPATTIAPPVGTQAFTCATIGRVAIRMAGAFTAAGAPINTTMSYTTITTAGAASFATMVPDNSVASPGYVGWSGLQAAGSAPTAAVDTKWTMTLGPIPASGPFTVYLLVQKRDATGAWVNHIVAPAVPCNITA